MFESYIKYLPIVLFYIIGVLYILWSLRREKSERDRIEYIKNYVHFVKWYNKAKSFSLDGLTYIEV